MVKETFTVPAFEVEIEGPDERGRYRFEGGVVWRGRNELAADARNDELGSRWRATCAAAVAYIDSLPKPDPKPGFTVRHEVDGEWKWTAVFSPSPEDVSNTKWPWNVTDNCGNFAWHTRQEFAALCERDGVTL